MISILEVSSPFPIINLLRLVIPVNMLLISFKLGVSVKERFNSVNVESPKNITLVVSTDCVSQVPKLIFSNFGMKPIIPLISVTFEVSQVPKSSVFKAD